MGFFEVLYTWSVQDVILYINHKKRTTIKKVLKTKIEIIKSKQKNVAFEGNNNI